MPSYNIDAHTVICWRYIGNYCRSKSKQSTPHTYSPAYAYTEIVRCMAVEYGMYDTHCTQCGLRGLCIVPCNNNMYLPGELTRSKHIPPNRRPPTDEPVIHLITPRKSPAPRQDSAFFFSSSAIPSITYQEEQNPTRADAVVYRSSAYACNHKHGKYTKVRSTRS